MPCYRPLQAWQRPASKPVFSPVAGARHIELPCGQCTGCKLDYSRQWAIRCCHENQMHLDSCMVTLTYDDAHLPPLAWLRHRDFQLFMKRFREERCRVAARRDALPADIRYFMCGEYGETHGRPHYHALIFGFSPVDKVFWKDSGAGFPAYTSEYFDSQWQNGAVYVGDVTFESAAYIARYLLKPTYDKDEAFLEILDPVTGEIFKRPREYCEMSTRPHGLGATWFQKFFSDVFPRDHVHLRGVKHAVPRYYNVLLERFSPLMLAELKERRVVIMDDRMKRLRVDFPELRFSDVRRLEVEERCKLASIRSLRRE